MIESLRDHADDSILEGDLCILGAGAAGIAIARELRTTPLRVILAESGGLAGDVETQQLYRAEVSGLDYAAEATRMRFFGGSTNCWTGFCAPLDALDFETRAWVPHSGWPITRAELEPYYSRAQPLLELGAFDYDVDTLAGSDLQVFLSSKLRNTLWRHSPPTRFGTHYRAELEAAPRIRVLLHANATEIVPDEAGQRVEEVRVRTLEGRSARLRARRFVLATGGIENPRLLLLSRGGDPRGIGNRFDLVGRFFMEHVIAAGALVAPSGSLDWLHGYEDIALPGGIRGSAGIGLSPEAQRRHSVLNVVATLVPGRVDLDAGYLALGRIRRALETGEGVHALAGEICRVLVDIDDIAEGIRANLRDEHYTAFREDTATRAVNLHVEQAPDPENRVTLSEELDALGLPRSRLAWRLEEPERQTIRVQNRLLGEELGRLGLGRLRQDDWIDDPTHGWPIAAVKCHHMGTTRMADDPRQGVVDARCRVHGVENLYLAGSSVFPTSGWANPTLTLVALALRLADHLRATAA